MERQSRDPHYILYGMLWMRERDEGTLLNDNDQLSGLVVRVSAFRLEGWWFDPWPGHAKDWYPMPPCLALSSL